MVVRTATWVARRVAAEQHEQVLAMAQALQLEVLAATDALVVLRTERGDVLEFCGPDHPVPDHLFAHGDTVVGFEVDDLPAATNALAVAGFPLLSAPTTGGGVQFQHFLGPDARVYGLIVPSDQPG